MSTNGVSKSKTRTCLICGEQTRIAHLGIDACRACAVFYRRAKKGNDFSCRSVNENCYQPAKVRSCKRCRFDRISTLIHHSNAKSVANSKTDSSALTSSRSETPLIDKLRAEYKSMCFAQLCAEVHARTEVTHPLEISLEKGPFMPVDFASITIAHRVLLTTSLYFGNEVFPEFVALHDSDRWKIVKNFLFPFRSLEGGYRSNRIYPDDPNMCFPSYASYFSKDSSTKFFSTAAQNGDVEGAQRHLNSKEFTDLIPEIRESIKRVNPSQEEFLVLVALTFWNIEDLVVSEAALRARSLYREAVLKELHVVYRNGLKLHDYAARLGELMMLVQVFERTRLLHEHMQVFRIYDVVPEDNFVYGLLKEE
ncbi:hypothetical protein PMAYCL1PPCAC_17119 [Pristionchus mayeri]|uniref:Nuclear receptor n=1 Tax=Pristionchus mayeri TaxID=1317129 RepID=A0AAN5CM30_9BILA|nr:hypothetical protein PMAYCL1PPCAC_17119 [Pristionchus mayeri]